MLINCAFYKVTLVDSHRNAGHLTPVNASELGKAESEGIPASPGKVSIVSGMLDIPVFIQVVYANADPVMSIAQLAVQPQGIICAQIHRGGERHMNHRPVCLGLCPEVQCIHTAVGFVGHDLITGYTLLDTCHRERTGVKQVVRVECPFQISTFIVGHCINIHGITGRNPDTQAEQLAGITLGEAGNLICGNCTLIPAVAYTFKIEVCICVFILTVIDKGSCHGFLIAEIEICLQRALCHTGQFADFAVFYTGLKVKYDLTLFILGSNQLHRTLTAAAFQMGGTILIMTTVPVVIHRHIDPVGCRSFLYLPGIRGGKDHSVDPNLGAILSLRELKFDTNNLIVTVPDKFKITDIYGSLIPAIACRHQRHRHILGVDPLASSFRSQLHSHLRCKVLKTEVCCNRSTCQIRQLSIKSRIQIRFQRNTGPEFTSLLFERRIQRANTFFCTVNIGIIIGIVTAAGRDAHIFPTQGNVLC